MKDRTSRRSPTLVLLVANCCECISVQIEHNSDRCHGEMYFDIVDYAMLGVLRGGTRSQGFVVALNVVRVDALKTSNRHVYA